MPSLSLEQHLKISKDANTYANRVGRKSPSREFIHLSTEEILLNPNHSILNRQFTNLRNKQKIKIQKKLSLGVYDPIAPPKDKKSDDYQKWAKAYFESNIQSAKEYFLGNCQELSMLAMEYCFRYPDLKCEIYAVENKDHKSFTKADHVFLVVGKSKSDNPEKPFGPYAVICDPWARKSYPATLENMKKNLVFISDNNKSKKYDPNLNRCNPILSLKMVLPETPSFKKNR